ncbi:MAG TPA: endonuclease/exonuclease/phosphatase family protein [Ktedonobacteraceae bacterium]|nr:endonuclease/exonuclease/phosphatase family protein [Ktedonobacteraceae bacterium]
MTRVLSYNILVGGTHRVEQLKRLIKSQQPDIVGLIEAIDEQVIREIADYLGMEYYLSGRAKDKQGWQGVILSYLPVLYTKIHASPIITKQPLLEVGFEEPDGQHLAVFLAHLTADFSQRREAYCRRRREIEELLHIMDARRGTRHMLMGDFNAIVSGERLKGSSFLLYVTHPSLYDQLQADPSITRPDLDFVLPPSLRLLKPLLKSIPKHEILASLLDRADAFYAPRGGIELMSKSGYVDCFRLLNPDEGGYTWPAPLPAGRVDYIFASPELVQTLSASAVVTEGDGVLASNTSDHLPILAEFGQPVLDDSPDEKSVTLVK